MQKIISVLFFMTVTFFSTFAQADETAVKDFLKKQSPEEERFISLLKKNKIDSCLLLFSLSLKKQIGTDKLIADLKKINAYYSKYPKPKTTPSLGQASSGVGAFGHDINGTWEKQSLYQFIDSNGKVIYYFTLYYDDSEPVGIIKNYDNMDMDNNIPILKPIKPPH